MWFHDEDFSGRRLFEQPSRPRRKRILKVKTRLRGKGQAASYRLAVFVLVPTVLIAAGVLAGFGVRAAARRLFLNNARYTITKLDIEVAEGAVITRTLIQEYTRVRTGLNLFAVEIGEIRRNFLRHAHNVKSMEISRRLPDTLSLVVTERTPLARLVQRRERDLALDREGYVFALRSKGKSLPAVRASGGTRLRPGSRVEGMARSALQVIDACENPMLGIRVKAVDIGNEEYLVLHLDGQKTVPFSWDRMGERTPRASRALARKLEWLAAALRTSEGRRQSKLDATFDDRIVGQR
jgi:hypothetical protein